MLNASSQLTKIRSSRATWNLRNFLDDFIYGKWSSICAWRQSSHRIWNILGSNKGPIVTEYAILTNKAAVTTYFIPFWQCLIHWSFSKSSIRRPVKL